MNHADHNHSADQEINWDELEKNGIVALKKHQFELDEYVQWLANGAAKENDNWAKHPFSGSPLPWSITSFVRMNIASLFEANRDDRELLFHAIVVVFKDQENKERFDAMAQSGPYF
jgi:hypothetical protein